MAQFSENDSVVVAHLRAKNEMGGGGQLAALMIVIGAIVMFFAVMGENSAIRLAAWAAIWIGWNVIFGAAMIVSTRTHYSAYRDKVPPS
jgi:hypothetical protein